MTWLLQYTHPGADTLHRDLHYVSQDLKMRTPSNIFTVAEDAAGIGTCWFTSNGLAWSINGSVSLLHITVRIVFAFEVGFM